MGLITLVVLIAVVVAVVFAQNTLVRRRNRVDEALGSISAYLKKRSDLIPNLVATVTKFTSHESSLLTELTELRTQASALKNDQAEMQEFDQKMQTTLGKINVAVEAYPELTSSDNYLSLQQSLNEVEGQLSAARRTYNANVVRYNDAVEMLPMSMVANVMRYKTLPVFEATVEEAKNPDVAALFKAA